MQKKCTNPRFKKALPEPVLSSFEKECLAKKAENEEKLKELKVFCDTLSSPKKAPRQKKKQARQDPVLPLRTPSKRGSWKCIDGCSAVVSIHGFIGHLKIAIICPFKRSIWPLWVWDFVLIVKVCFALFVVSLHI